MIILVETGIQVPNNLLKRSPVKARKVLQCILFRISGQFCVRILEKSENCNINIISKNDFVVCFCFAYFEPSK